jgi:hypothetical protein
MTTRNEERFAVALWVVICLFVGYWFGGRLEHAAINGWPTACGVLAPVRFPSPQAEAGQQRREPAMHDQDTPMGQNDDVFADTDVVSTHTQGQGIEDGMLVLLRQPLLPTSVLIKLTIDSDGPAPVFCRLLCTANLYQHKELLFYAVLAFDQGEFENTEDWEMKVWHTRLVDRNNRKAAPEEYKLWACYSEDGGPSWTLMFPEDY